MKRSAYKYRLYPTEEQKIILNKTMGCCRWLWNHAIREIKEAEKEKKKDEKINVFEIIDDVQNKITELKNKEDTAFLKDAISSSLIRSLRNLQTAYKNYFRDLKNGRIEQKRKNYIAKCKKHKRELKNSKLYDMGKPKNKIRNHEESCQFHQSYFPDFANSVINMPKCPNVKTVFHRRFNGVHKTCTVERTASGKYFASILVQDLGFKIPEKSSVDEKTTVGLHNGISTFVTSDEDIVIAKTNRFLRTSIKRMKVLQKRLSKKYEINGKQKTNRWNNARIQIAKLHEKIKNQRNYLLHQVSVALINNPKYQTICVENWDKEAMMDNKIFAQAIADVSWESLINLIKYKAEWSGKNIIELDPHAPNAKTCNVCEHINEWVELRHRIWTCENCGAKHKREFNCAKNTKQMGLKTFFDSELV